MTSTTPRELNLFSIDRPTVPQNSVDDEKRTATRLGAPQPGYGRHPIESNINPQHFDPLGTSGEINKTDKNTINNNNISNQEFTIQQEQRIKESTKRTISNFFNSDIILLSIFRALLVSFKRANVENFEITLRTNLANMFIAFCSKNNISCRLINKNKYLSLEISFDVNEKINKEIDNLFDQKIQLYQKLTMEYSSVKIKDYSNLKNFRKYLDNIKNITITSSLLTKLQMWDQDRQVLKLDSDEIGLILNNLEKLKGFPEILNAKITITDSKIAEKCMSQLGEILSDFISSINDLKEVPEIDAIYEHLYLSFPDN